MLNSNISADCTTVDLALKIEVDDSEFPARHGTVILFTCPRKHAKQNVNTDARCDNGEIKFSSDDPDLSPCTKIGW